MIIVLFESSSHAEQIATFENEDVYKLCLPALQQRAAEVGCIITEYSKEAS